MVVVVITKPINKLIAELKESEAVIVATFPSLWYNMYNQCRIEGFSRRDALDLVKTWIKATNGVGDECDDT